MDLLFYDAQITIRPCPNGGNELVIFFTKDGMQKIRHEGGMIREGLREIEGILAKKSFELQKGEHGALVICEADDADLADAEAFDIQPLLKEHCGLATIVVVEKISRPNVVA